jgi:hypothetical protein
MNKGVRKSASDVTKGIRKLLGSIPRLNKNIAPRNSIINIIKKMIKTVAVVIKIIISGYTIFTPDITPIENPNINKKSKLSKRVISRPNKSSFILLDF